MELTVSLENDVEDADLPSSQLDLTSEYNDCGMELSEKNVPYDADDCE